MGADEAVQHEGQVGEGVLSRRAQGGGHPRQARPDHRDPVDNRRRNISLEGLQANVNRLKMYKSKLVLFPRNLKKPKAGDASAEELQTATQLGGTTVMPPKKAPTLKMVALDSEQKNNKAFAKLRVERMNQRMVGIRHKRALAEEAAAKEAAKLK